VDALRWYVQGLSERSALDIELQIPPNFERLSSETELVIFRVVQEALTNVHRHSGSKTAAIRLAQDGAIISVQIQDWGAGMTAEKLAEIQSHGSGVGIRGIRERVRQLKGEMKINSSVSGTRITVTFPVSECSRLYETEKARTYCVTEEPHSGERIESRLANSDR
jgi:signal transduction histidine kinase